MILEVKYMTNNPYYKAMRYIKPVGFMLHSIGCGQPDPDTIFNSFNQTSRTDAAVHGFIGATKVIEALPVFENTSTSGNGFAHRAPHCGKGIKGCGNDTYLGFEMCEPSQIKYIGTSDKFTCTNRTEAIKYVESVIRNAIELFAKLCVHFNKNPLEKGVIISHNEGNIVYQIASGHTDPEHLWKGLSMDYNMDKFRNDVYKKYCELKNIKPQPVQDSTTKTTKVYRVQVGSFSNKQNADNFLKTVRAVKTKLFDYSCAYLTTDQSPYYKVQVGAFSVRDNAVRMCNDLKAVGFSCFIVE